MRDRIGRIAGHFVVLVVAVCLGRPGLVEAGMGQLGIVLRQVMGAAVVVASPTTGDVLQYDGTNWVDAALAAAVGTVLSDGTVSLSADWDAGSYEIRARTLESDVATGTAPFTVASATPVTNLAVTATGLPGQAASAGAVTSAQLTGSVPIMHSSGWSALAPGTAGLPLVSAGAGEEPAYGNDVDLGAGEIGVATVEGSTTLALYDDASHSLGITLSATEIVVGAEGSATITTDEDDGTGNPALRFTGRIEPASGDLVLATATGTVALIGSSTDGDLEAPGELHVHAHAAALLDVTASGVTISDDAGGAGDTCEIAATTTATTVTLGSGANALTIADASTGGNVLFDLANQQIRAPGLGTMTLPAYTAQGVTNSGLFFPNTTQTALSAAGIQIASFGTGGIVFARTVILGDDLPLRLGTGQDTFIQGELSPLTDAAASTVFVVATTDGDLAGLEITYTIQCTDATDATLEQGTVRVLIDDRAGGATATITEDAGTIQHLLGGQTLATTWSVVVAATTTTVQVLADTSIATPTTMQIRWTAVYTGDVTVSLP